MEILLLGSLIGLMVLAKRFLRAPAPFIPFLTLLALASTLYVGSLLGALFYVAWLAYVLGLLALVGLPLTSIVASPRHAHTRRVWMTGRALAVQLARNPIGPPIGAFVVLCGLSYVVFGALSVSEWDEFSSWGLRSKAVIRYDDIFAYPDIQAADYPRLGSLFHYFFHSSSVVATSMKVRPSLLRWRSSRPLRRRSWHSGEFASSLRPSSAYRSTSSCRYVSHGPSRPFTKTPSLVSAGP